jgi:hypothetical protein
LPVAPTTSVGAAGRGEGELVVGMGSMKSRRDETVHG